MEIVVASKQSMPRWGWALLWVLIPMAVACAPTEPRDSRQVFNQTELTREVVGACRIAMADTGGTDEIDREITRLQTLATRSADPVDELERLGWLFVLKARLSYDPGFYKLAEQCALCLESKSPDSNAALLLRGHVLHSLHRFVEAQVIAGRLVEKRGISYDYGLLGDVLMEQGKLDAAIAAYQQMVDIKPDIHAYNRIAHIRWLKGDLSGATRLIRMAARAGSARNPEPVAWAYSRLALYELQAGDYVEAHRACELALDLAPNYAPALLARGRILLAQGKEGEAVDSLTRAVARNPLPEYQWWLAESLQQVGRLEEARALEDALRQQGRVDDPRTLAIYLATRRQDVPRALRLIRQDLEARQDVFTWDGLAWSLQAAGKTPQAMDAIAVALKEGTQDARLFFHAGVIFDQAGHPQQAAQWFERAREIEQMLYPSERSHLRSVSGMNTERTGSVLSQLTPMQPGG